MQASLLKKIRPLDFAVLGLALVLTGFAAYWVYAKPDESPQVHITATGGREWIYPIDAEETLRVPGPLGITVVRIQGGDTWVESSPCANKVCVNAGHVQGPGSFVACLPNNVMIVIEGNDGQNQVDYVVR
ncbi:MAG: NusG domain II-containing protein [Treponema sp.]|jgi:hypothetical protein|nr:NusG domain II-containing protein [Treponema sp.]